MIATEVHRRLTSDCDGYSEWQYWQVAGIGEALGSRRPCARAKSIRGRQDSCAVHDLRASDGENAPWWQDVRAVYSPTALCGAFWIHSTHILPKLGVFEYIQAICCHELVFFSSEAPSGTHRGDILPWPAAWERIRAQSCHGHAPDDRRRSSSTAYLRLQWAPSARAAWCRPTLSPLVSGGRNGALSN